MAVLAVLAAGPGVVPGVRPALDPLDLALVRGEAVFETLRVYAGRPFRLGAHLARLAASAAALDLALPGGLEELAGRAATAAGERDAALRLICTRGPEDAPVPSAFAVCSELPAAWEQERRRGLKLVLLTLACDPLVRAASPWLLPGVKSTSYAVNMAAQRTARARGADDAVFVGLGGELLEAPTASLWWRARDTLYTPALDLGILAGVTRSALCELASGLGLRVLEGVFTAEDLAGAEEAFLSSSTREVMPVVQVDGARVGDGRPGPVAAELQMALRRLAGGERAS
ncbi:MAG TPA: aminotransferase class IV [Actinomycetota bacterium]|nr:aminotransferase class IV [Actinomycetota bacterium]